MKKLVSISVVALLALSMVALAGSPGDRTIVGTATQIDSAAKPMSVRDDAGNTVTVYWNADTKLDAGMPQEGATVSVTIDNKDANNSRPIAKSISVQQPTKQN